MLHFLTLLDLCQENRRQVLCDRRKSLLSKADGEGFEPPVPCGTPVFKTGAFDHSATRPVSYWGLLDLRTPGRNPEPHCPPSQ